jgi:centromeric protein E
MPGASNAENIRVAVRCRPLNGRERAANARVIFRREGASGLVLADPSSTESAAKAERRFAFDFVYDQTCEQHELFRDVGQPILDRAFAGFNGTIFAYGQTSSGKTHTMLGSSADPGVTVLAIHDIFRVIATRVDHDYLVVLSYLEIYNERIQDLLVDPGSKSKKNGWDDRAFFQVGQAPIAGESLEIFDDKIRGPSVKGLTEVVVLTPEDCLEWLTRGQRAKHVAATQMNSESSRSHTLFRLLIESREVIGGEGGNMVDHWEKDEGTRREKKKRAAEGKKMHGPTKCSTLYLVDLAGSERVGRSTNQCVA